MAENLYLNSIEEENKLELIGNLIMKIESVLTPKPINVWNVRQLFYLYLLLSPYIHT